MFGLLTINESPSLSMTDIMLVCIVGKGVSIPILYSLIFNQVLNNLDDNLNFLHDKMNSFSELGLNYKILPSLFYK